MATSAVPQVRERTAYEIIDFSIQLYRRHFATIVMIMVLSAFPSWIVLWMSGVFTLLSPTHPVGSTYGFNPLVFALMPVVWVWGFVVKNGIIVAASDAYLEGTIDPARAIKTALSKWLQLIGAAIGIRFVAVIAGAFTFSIAGFYLFLRWFAVVPVLLIENKGFEDAFHRSRDLSQGFKMRILGTQCLAWLIVFAVIFALQLALAFVPMAPAARLLINAVAEILVLPVVSIVLTVLYYDQRIRKDGFDLEMMTRDLVAAPVGS